MRVEGYAGYLERVILGERDEAMQDLRYGLPRIYLPRTPVHTDVRYLGEAARLQG